MLFVQLSDMLKDRFAVWSYISDSNARVNMLLFGGINCMLNEPDTSYFFAYSNFNKSMTLPQNVIASFDSEFEKFELLNAAERDNSNIILVPTKESTNVLNFAQMLLVSSLRESDNYAVFLRMILNGRDLSYILTEAAKPRTACGDRFQRQNLRPFHPCSGSSSGVENVFEGRLLPCRIHAALL